MQPTPRPYMPGAPFALAADAAIDLQTHTTLSDGYWSPTEHLDHVAGEGFALVAITDHDRPDTVDELQRLAGERGVRVIPAVEMSTLWQDEMCDVLVFGVRPGPHDLATIAATTRTAQLANFRETFDALQRNGFSFPRAAELLPLERGGVPQQLDDLITLMREHGYTNGMGAAVKAAGFQWITAELGRIVAAAHAIGALALIAHPGRGDGFVRFDAAMLDDLRKTIPIDGIEVWHPTHTPAQVADFLAYTSTNNLLASAGSDSHGPPGILPIKYHADSCRALLERLEISVVEA